MSWLNFEKVLITKYKVPVGREFVYGFHAYLYFVLCTDYLLKD